jgi:hypothetical protein
MPGVRAGAGLARRFKVKPASLYFNVASSADHSEPPSDESWERISHGLHILLPNWQVRQPGASPNDATIGRIAHPLSDP